ncbi:hypothetical protein [Streptomyces sp. NPDC089799]|uniref:hypothetical protein n=1 Tax=Streptomyces sp. NPDC089799 TaxID=3155066 RepID=UPI00342E8E4F
MTILSDFDDFDSMEVAELIDGSRGDLLLEFRFDSNSARLIAIGAEVEIPLLRAAIEVFRGEFLDPLRLAGEPCPPW